MIKVGKLILFGGVMFLANFWHVYAAPPTGMTTAPYTMAYTAKLVNASGNPITTAHNLRFSIWSDADSDAADYLGSGAIDPAAVGFTSWQEEYTVTPNADGIFTLRLGSQTTFPSFNVGTHIFLQVEVKPDTTPLTAYEVLDPDGNIANTTDRKPIDAMAYAMNSDTVDNRDVDNTAGNIPFLDGTGKLIFGVLPDGVNANSFVLDVDNNAPGNTITLQFGAAIGEFLRWNDGLSRFDLSDDLNVDGNLTFTGTASIIGATIDGTLNTLQNIPYTAISPHVKTVRLIPEYSGTSIDYDGSDNIGTLKLKHDSAVLPGDRQNYYLWTTNLAAAQDLELVVRYNLPTEFVSFTGTPISLMYQTADNVTANNKVDLTLNDSVGAAVGLTGASNLASSGVWSTANITFVGVPTFTADSMIEFRVKMTSINAGKFVKLGDLVLNYNTR